MTGAGLPHVVETRQARRRCFSEVCWPGKEGQPASREGSLRVYSDGSSVWTCGLCYSERGGHG